ncbi:hypothetical protein TGFOU_317820 [Toxoplasma gondii FOU]|uniref:Uncharacterized protein n=1 Tax=Toxoplasma gondii FOU TaxID=943167 RepID=A0A086JHV0_TOXGO|nr:hypothetical protein TGFOU_317820 [Toxoplasma gondii FOU]
MRHESGISRRTHLTVSSYRQVRLRGHDLWASFHRRRNKRNTLDSTMFLLLEREQTLCLTGIGWPAYSVTENEDRGIQRTERLLTSPPMLYLCHLTDQRSYSFFLLNGRRPSTRTQQGDKSRSHSPPTQDIHDVCCMSQMGRNAMTRSVIVQKIAIHDCPQDRTL